MSAGQVVSLDELRAFEGRELSPSGWISIDQERIQRFADCTDDHQFIHVDPEKMMHSPFGGTIAHGFLTLSLVAAHGPDDWPTLRDTQMTLNYGVDRVRFITPVRVGTRVRFRTRILSVEEKAPGKVLVKSEKTLEIEGEESPGMVAEVLAMFITIDA